MQYLSDYWINSNAIPVLQCLVQKWIRALQVGTEEGEESGLMQSAAITDDPEECKTPPVVEKDSLMPSHNSRYLKIFKFGLIDAI